ncbi:grancalcin-like isoform X3 [Nerophis ophidion]|uniref:grancalcin-like isoform X3 n=1 Tax=Nerophis ophidion TaxID=159077 RepID=UPI002ADF553F|nr:grancalcin-like isoform X3 [Nerophis ophidion]
MAYPGYGGYGSPMLPYGAPGGPVGGHMSSQMGGPMGGMPPRVGGYAPYGGGYSNTYGAPSPAANDPMWGYFTAIAGQDGEVDAEELQRCLTQAGFTGTYSPFSLETCRIMIAMLDRDFTGKMGFNEFKELFMALNGWKQNFMMFDRNRSGTVEPHEMNQAISSMGYRISPQALNAILKRYNKGGRIFFDDYVACCVKLRALTENFKRRDTMQRGSVNFLYDDEATAKSKDKAKKTDSESDSEMSDQEAKKKKTGKGRRKKNQANGTVRPVSRGAGSRQTRQLSCSVSL